MVSCRNGAAARLWYPQSGYDYGSPDRLWEGLFYLLTHDLRVRPLLPDVAFVQDSGKWDGSEASQLAKLLLGANSMLAQEVDRGSPVPIVQGLPLYAARKSACAQAVWGFPYTGIMRHGHTRSLSISPRS